VRCAAKKTRTITKPFLIQNHSRNFPLKPLAARKRFTNAYGPTACGTVFVRHLTDTAFRNEWRDLSAEQFGKRFELGGR